jgi:hypothetical protein
MQLSPWRSVRVAQTLGLLTAELFAATAGHAQEAPPSPASTINDDTASDLGLTRVDAAVLYYQEAGGRVRATEPMASVTVNSQGGDIFSLRLSADTLTGATPNGTTPWKEEQAFVKGDAVTGASGVVTAAPHVLPVDPGFRDKRYAADASYSFLAGADTRLTAGGGYSKERDYRSASASLGVAHDFNRKNTTAAIAVNFEHDRSKPIGGTPAALKAIDGVDPNGGNDSKTVTSVLLGVTQVISRTWLMQINYSYGRSAGYQTDPYRLISVVDPLTGGPVQYLYEGRPRTRVRQSIYVGNKVALGAQVLDISARAYKDDWGIRSATLQASDRLPLSARLYAEPLVRYYHQSAADFFRYYLLSRDPLPAFASSDVRLGRFNAVTLGMTLGYKIGHGSEVYVRGSYYRQTGKSRPADAPGDLASEKLFSGVKAASIMVGYSFAFD